MHWPITIPVCHQKRTKYRKKIQYMRHRVSVSITGDIVFILPSLGVADFCMETLLECGVYRVQCTPLSHIIRLTVNPNTLSLPLPTPVSWIHTAQSVNVGNFLRLLAFALASIFLCDIHVRIWHVHISNSFPQWTRYKYSVLPLIQDAFLQSILV